MSGTPSPLRSNLSVAAAWGTTTGRPPDLPLAGSVDGATANAKTLLYRNTVGGSRCRRPRCPSSRMPGRPGRRGPRRRSRRGVVRSRRGRVAHVRLPQQRGARLRFSTMTGSSARPLAFGDYDGGRKARSAGRGFHEHGGKRRADVPLPRKRRRHVRQHWQFFRNAYLCTVGFCGHRSRRRHGLPETGRDSVGAHAADVPQRGRWAPVPSRLPALDFGANFVLRLDADGDLDLVINGSTTPGSVSGARTFLYRNDGTGTFTVVNTSGLSASCNGSRGDRRHRRRRPARHRLRA